MPQSRFRSHAILVLIAATTGGCGPQVDAPRFDFAGSTTYRVEEFKDEAPANARVDATDFPLSFLDSEGATVDLRTYQGKQKVVLVVLRGIPRADKAALCPTCLAQTASLMANREEFSRRKAEVLVVFPGPSERLGEFLRKAKDQAPGEPDPAFRILLDRECLICGQLGIRDDLAKPSTYVLDTRGNPVYAYVGETSTDRPSIKAILNQLDKAK